MYIKNNTKIAVITGAGHRLGRIFALSLAKKGYAILLHYNSSQAQAMETAAEIRSYDTLVYPFKANLMDPSEIFKLWEYVDKLPHVLDLLINSAAMMRQGDIRSLPTKEFDDSIGLNLRAPLICSQEAAKRMSMGGLIINISDIGAGKNWLSFPIYSISKAALEVLTTILAKALAPEIRVNAIAPGLVFPPKDERETSWEKLVNKVPLKRSAFPEEITSLVDYLILNKYITGQIIEIDGGYSL